MTLSRADASKPLVSIVTPSFNQAKFIGAAIDSVLSQDYPSIEYLVVDGGSTDGTLDVLESYGDRVEWLSEPDGGQADAINKGFRRARGSIIAWLNSDDVYAPGAVTKAVQAFDTHPGIALVYGNGSIIDENGETLGAFVEIEPFSLWRLVHGLDYILQPATFFSREIAERVDFLDESLEYGLDWDLWIRLTEHGDVHYLREDLAMSRVYGATKTSTGGWRRIGELRRLARRHSGRRLTPGVQLYALDTLVTTLAGALPASFDRLLRAAQRRLSGRIMRRMPVHADGWLAPQGRILAPRRWRRAQIELEAHQLPRRGAAATEVRADGRRLAQATLREPGGVSLVVDLPPGASAFVELQVRSDFSFRAQPPDDRRLALRCAEVRAVVGGESVVGQSS